MGERVLEIPAALADRPFVIGRGSEAGLVVPSTSVALRQCALFVHKGRWTVQEWVPAGTRLNGKPLSGPAPLSTGDVLSFGADASQATLEIDPGNAAARRGSPVLEAVQGAPTAPQASPRPAPRKAPIAAAPPAQSAVPKPAPAPPRPARATPVPGTGAAILPPAGATEDTVDWSDQATAASAPVVSYSRPRGRKQSSAVQIVIAIVLAVGIIGGTVRFAYKKLQRPPVVVIIQPVEPPKAKPKPVNLFEENPKSAPVAAVSTADASDASAAPSPTPPTPAAAGDNSDEPDAHAGDPEWTDVMVAHDGPNPGIAIVRYDDYRRRNPGKGAKVLNQLNQFEQEALDRMWWGRIVQLFHRRSRLVDEIAAADNAIADESQASYKVTLQADKASKLSDLKSAEDSLRNDMAYTADEPPDIDNAQALAAARAARNPEKFAEWSRNIETYIRRHAGETPWGEEDQ